MAADPAHRMVRGAFAPADEEMVEEEAEEDYENSSPTTVSAGWMWTGRDTERSASGRELTRRRSGDGLPLVPRPQPRQEPPLPSYAEFLGGSGDGSDGGGDGGSGNPSLKIESALLVPYTDSGAASPAATAATAAATKAAIASAAAASAASAAAAAAAAAVVGIAAGDELRVAPMMMEAVVDSRVSSKESAGAAGSPDGVAVWASGAASSDAAGPDRPLRGDPGPQGDSAAAASTGGDVKNALLPDQSRTVTVAQTTSPPPTKIDPTEAERRGEREAEERGVAWEAETAAASAATAVAPEGDLATLTGEGVPSRRKESSAPAEATAAAVEGQLGLYCGDLIASAETPRPDASVKMQRSIQQVLVQQEPSADGTSQAESDRAGAEVVGDGSGGGDGNGGEGGGGSGGGVIAGGGVREGSTAGWVRGGVQAQALEMRETGTGHQTKQWGGTKRTAGTSASMVFGEGVRVEARSPSQGDRGWTGEAMGADVEPRTVTPRPVEVETQGVEESVETAAEVPSPRRLVESPPWVSPSASVSEEVVPLVETAGDIAPRGAGTSVLPLRFAVERTEPAAAVAASEVEVGSSEVDVVSARENRVSSSRTHSDADEEGVENSAATGVSPPSRLGTSDTAATHQGSRGGHYEVGSAKADVASMRDNRVPSCETPAEVDEEGVEISAAAAGVSSPSRLSASNIAVTDTSAHQAKREGEGIAAAARAPAAAAAAGAVPLVGNNARGREIESLARAWKMRDNRGGEADLAADLADAAAEEAAVTPAPGRARTPTRQATAPAGEVAAAQEATLTADVHVAEPWEIGVDATSRHVANRGAGEVEGGAAVAAGVAVALSAIKNAVAPALPPPEAVGRTIDEVARRGDADELRVEEGKEAREKRETVVDARNGPAAATVGAAPGRGERKAELSRGLLETAPVGTVLEAGTGAADSRVVSQTGVPEKFEAGGSVDVAAEDVGADEAAAATGNGPAAGTAAGTTAGTAAAAALEANLAPCAKSRKRETFAAEAAAEAAVAAATSSAAAVAMSSNGNRTRGGSVVLRSRSCSASAWPGPEDLDETFPPITVEEAAAFMGSAADGFGAGAAGFGQRFASKSSWTSTATSAIADIDRSASSLPPSTPTLAAGSPPTRSAGFGGKGTSGRGWGVHHAGAAPAGSASATAAAAAVAAGGGGVGEDGAPVWGEAAFGSFPGLDHFLSSSVDGFSGVRARRVGSDVPYSRTRAAGDGYRRAAATRRSNSLDAGDFSTTGGMDDRRRSSVDGAVGVRRGAPAPELASESGRLGGSGAVGVSRGEGSPAADGGGGGGAVTVTEEKVVEKEEVEAEEEVGGGGQNGSRNGVPLQQTLIAPGRGGGNGGGSGGDCGGGPGSGGGDGDGSFGNGGTNPLSSTALTMGAAATVEKPVGGDVASGTWVERKGGAVVVAQAEDALGSGSVSKPSAAPVVITTSAATSLLDNGGEGRLESPLVGGDRRRPGAGSGARGSSGGGGGGCCVMS